MLLERWRRKRKGCNLEDITGLWRGITTRLWIGRLCSIRFVCSSLWLPSECIKAKESMAMDLIESIESL